ncbi:hypothetical protein AGMMS50268_09550 [Spirochaetia bacterium]|nr:hypothetical protein AGMMS50268_09550 [Spirochaetia bacterium]
MNVRELSEKYLEKTLENPNAAGSPYTLIDTENVQYPVVGTVGDISMLIDPITGETISGRTITTTCMMKRLPVQPKRGWRAELPDLAGSIQKLYVQEISPDHTTGIYYFVMSLDLREEPAA